MSKEPTRNRLTYTSQLRYSMSRKHEQNAAQMKSLYSSNYDPDFAPVEDPKNPSKFQSIIHKAHNDLLAKEKSLKKNKTDLTIDPNIKSLLHDRIYLEQSPLSHNAEYILRRGRGRGRGNPSRTVNKDRQHGNYRFDDDFNRSSPKENYHAYNNTDDNHNARNYAGEFKNQMTDQMRVVESESNFMRKSRKPKDRYENYYDNSKRIFSAEKNQDAPVTILNIDKIESNAPLNRRNYKSTSFKSITPKHLRNTQPTVFETTYKSEISPLIKQHKRNRSFDYKKKIKLAYLSHEESKIHPEPISPTSPTSPTYKHIPKNSSLFSNIYDKYNQRLSSYIVKHKDSIRLYGSMRYTNKPPQFFLQERKERKANPPDADTNCKDFQSYNPYKLRGGIVDLTPLPSKSRKRMKSQNEKKEFFEVERSAVAMRRFEYTNLIKGRKSAFKEMKDQDFDEDFMCYLIKIQRWLKSLLRNPQNEKIIKIQKVFRGHLIRNRIRAIGEIFKKIQEKINFMDNLLWKKLLGKSFGILKNLQKRPLVKDKKNEFLILNSKNFTHQDEKDHLYDINFNVKEIHTAPNDDDLDNILNLNNEPDLVGIIHKPLLKKPSKLTKTQLPYFLIKRVFLIQRLWRKLIKFIKHKKNEEKVISKQILKPAFIIKTFKSLDLLFRIVKIQRKFLNLLSKKKLEEKRIRSFKSRPKLPPQIVTKEIKSLEALLKLFIIQRKFKSFISKSKAKREKENIPTVKKTLLMPLYQKKTVRSNYFIFNIIKIQRSWIRRKSKFVPQVRKVLKSVKITKQVKSLDQILKIVLLQRKFKQLLFKKKLNKLNKEKEEKEVPVKVRSIKLKSVKITKQVKSLHQILKIVLLQRKFKQLLFKKKLNKLNNDKVEREKEVKMRNLLKSVKITKQVKSLHQILKIVLLQRKFKQLLFKKKLNKLNKEKEKEQEQAKAKAKEQEEEEEKEVPVKVKSIKLKSVKITKQVKALDQMLKILLLQRKFKNLLLKKRLNKEKEEKEVPVKVRSIKLKSVKITKQVKSFDQILKIIFLQRKFKQLLFKKKLNKEKVQQEEVPVKVRSVLKSVKITKQVKSLDQILKIVLLQRKFKQLLLKKKLNKEKEQQQEKEVPIKVRSIKLKSVKITKQIKALDQILKIILLQRKFKNLLLKKKLNKEKEQQQQQQQEKEVPIKVRSIKLKSVKITKQVKSLDQILKIIFLQRKFKNLLLKKKLNKEKEVPIKVRSIKLKSVKITKQVKALDQILKIILLQRKFKNLFLKKKLNKEKEEKEVPIKVRSVLKSIKITKEVISLDQILKIVLLQRKFKQLLFKKKLNKEKEQQQEELNVKIIEKKIPPHPVFFSKESKSQIDIKNVMKLQKAYKKFLIAENKKKKIKAKFVISPQTMTKIVSSIKPKLIMKPKVNEIAPMYYTKDIQSNQLLSSVVKLQVPIRSYIKNYKKEIKQRPKNISTVMSKKVVSLSHIAKIMKLQLKFRKWIQIHKQKKIVNRAKSVNKIPSDKSLDYITKSNVSKMALINVPKVKSTCQNYFTKFIISRTHYNQVSKIIRLFKLNMMRKTNAKTRPIIRNEVSRITKSALISFDCIFKINLIKRKLRNLIIKKRIEREKEESKLPELPEMNEMSTQCKFSNNDINQIILTDSHFSITIESEKKSDSAIENKLINNWRKSNYINKNILTSNSSFTKSNKLNIPISKVNCLQREIRSFLSKNNKIKNQIQNIQIKAKKIPLLNGNNFSSKDYKVDLFRPAELIKNSLLRLKIKKMINDEKEQQEYNLNQFLLKTRDRINTNVKEFVYAELKKSYDQSKQNELARILLLNMFTRRTSKVFDIVPFQQTKSRLDHIDLSYALKQIITKKSQEFSFNVIKNLYTKKTVFELEGTFNIIPEIENEENYYYKTLKRVRGITTSCGEIIKPEFKKLIESIFPENPVKCIYSHKWTFPAEKRKNELFLNNDLFIDKTDANLINFIDFCLIKERNTTSNKYLISARLIKLKSLNNLNIFAIMRLIDEIYSAMTSNRLCKLCYCKPTEGCSCDCHRNDDDDAGVDEFASANNLDNYSSIHNISIRNPKEEEDDNSRRKLNIKIKVTKKDTIEDEFDEDYNVLDKIMPRARATNTKRQLKMNSIYKEVFEEKKSKAEEEEKTEKSKDKDFTKIDAKFYPQKSKKKMSSIVNPKLSSVRDMLRKNIPQKPQITVRDNDTEDIMKIVKGFQF